MKFELDETQEDTAPLSISLKLSLLIGCERGNIIISDGWNLGDQSDLICTRSWKEELYC